MVTRAAEAADRGAVCAGGAHAAGAACGDAGVQGMRLYSARRRWCPVAGAARARLMLVGEQPGDQEDQQGEPFVGPAGACCARRWRAAHRAGEVYMTNAVKHFKFVQRGKLRLHQNPRMGEINACRPWLLAEIDAVKPRVVLCLGASAAKSLLGGTFALMKSAARCK